MKPTFWSFAVYLILGLLALSLVPSAARGWAILILLMGGAAIVEYNGGQRGGIQQLLTQLQGG